MTSKLEPKKAIRILYFTIKAKTKGKILFTLIRDNWIF